MEPVEIVFGTALPLNRSDVDTDQIIPSDWLKRVERTGFDRGLFSEWRDNPSFVLNDERFTQATILVAGPNFGTGSSREHAVWALYQWGIRAIVAPSFGSIFYNNCIQNGILPVLLKTEKIRKLQTFVELNPAVNQLTVDLRDTTIIAGSTIRYSFEIEPSNQQNLLQGLDAIGSTLKMMASIEAFEENDHQTRPWVYFK